MTCDQCRSEMIKVGREIQPGNSSTWIEGYVCPTRACAGYGTLDYRGHKGRWPALTLMDHGISLMIWGALNFKKGLK